MSFKKEALSFYEMMIVFVGFSITGLLMFFVCFSENKPVALLFLFFALFFSLIAVFNFKNFHNDYITINEIGVSCYKKDEILWEYKWCEIAKFKKINLLRWPAVAVIIYNEFGEPDQFALEGHSFQLCRTAQKALNMYGKEKTIE